MEEESGLKTTSNGVDASIPFSLLMGSLNCLIVTIDV
jgi:hypothetical protein